jgi:hypothetical protein
MGTLAPESPVMCHTVAREELCQHNVHALTAGSNSSILMSEPVSYGAASMTAS